MYDVNKHILENTLLTTEENISKDITKLWKILYEYELCSWWQFSKKRKLMSEALHYVGKVNTQFNFYKKAVNKF